MSDAIPWHRLFGLSWIDFFRGLPVEVELEKDLSLKQQLLDVVLVRKGTGPLPRRPPDGFEDLAAHNLITFKSSQQALDGWALSELLGHYVNYRKQVSPSMRDLLPEDDFRLFAVAARFPEALARQTALAPVRPGVYEAAHFTGRVRVVVVGELPREEHNALLLPFSAQPELFRYGALHYHLRSDETSTLLVELFNRLRLEDPKMVDLLTEMARNTRKNVLAEATVEERLEGITSKELLRRVAPADRLEGLSVDDLLAALPPEARAALARRLAGEGPPPGAADGR